MFILRLLPSGIRSRIQQHMPVKWLVGLCLWLLLFLLCFTVAFKFTEVDAETGDPLTWEESVWVMWQTATTVGYGDLPAASSAGRWATMLFGLVAIAFLGTCISAAFDVKAYMRDRKRYGLMNNPVTDGYVVFNFPGEDVLLSFINEIRSVEQDVGVCVVDSRIEELPTSIAMLNNIHFLRGTALSRETYERARVKDNKAAVIFPLDPKSSDSDGTTKTIVDLILRFVEDDTRIIYVLVKAENSWMFDPRAMGVWQNLEALAVVQECQDPNSAGIIQKLLKNTEGANPFTVKPSRVIGWTWRDFELKVIQVGADMSVPVNTFALIRDRDTNSCPDYDTKIREGDLISLIAGNDFDWDSFETSLAEKGA